MKKGYGKIGTLVVFGLFMAIMLSPSAIAVLEYEVSTDDDGVGVENNEEILFDMDQNEIEILGAKVGIGDTSPDFKLEVTGSSGGYFGVTSSSDGDIFIIDSSGNGIFNDGSGDRDFRIEGNGDANLFFADAGNDKIGIGTSTPDAKLDVEVSSGGAAEIGKSDCSATGDYAIAMGYDTEASGTASTAMGRGTTASGTYSTAMGYNTEASGLYSFAAGLANEASGDYSTAIGVNTHTTGDCSFAVGTHLTAGPADDTFVLGKGVDWLNPLVNNVQSSFMVGFDSTTPTLYVDGSSVGIGTTSPGSRLEIKGSGVEALTSALHVKNFADTSLLFVRDDGNVGIGVTGPAEKLEVDGNIVLNTGADRTFYVETPKSTSDGYDLTIEASDAYWVSGIPGYSGGDLYLGAGDGAGLSYSHGGDVFIYGGDMGLDGSYGDVILAHTGSVARGKVGIGTTIPNEKLEVDGKVRANTGFNVNGADGKTQTVIIEDNLGSTHTFEFTGGILTSYVKS